jgi:hypothetical protein
MDNKNTNEKKSNISADMFEVHTMKKDIEGLANVAEPPNSSPTRDSSAPRDKKDNIHKNVPQHPSANPFLENGEERDGSLRERSTFGARKPDKIDSEKINYSPADIAPKSQKTNVPPVKKKNSVLMSMIIFVIVFLCGVAGFGFYLWQKNAESDITIAPDEDTTIMTNDELLSDAPVAEEVYLTTVPNYFSFDVESPDAQTQITTELNMIEQKLGTSDIDVPVSFVVTDQNDYPVSFHVFALSTGMKVPTAVSAALEEGFEVYAYNDQLNGVRFAFAIDVKNINGLQEALAGSESELPQAFNIVLDNMDTTPSAMTFKDSTYNTHPIRYVNLDPQESYSIDYTITNQKFVIGTSKETLRAVLDLIKSQTTFAR